jgi:cysteinyl-tRNA synthetase
MALNVEALKIEIAAAIGKRVSIRLREDGSFRDLLGVLRDENSLVKKDGTVATFAADAIAYFRVVPVFNRSDIQAELKMKELHLYETASRKLQKIEGGLIRIYSCGPTVYRDAHIGNMRTFLLTDLIRRSLALNGVETLSVSNITDVGHMSENLDGSDSGDKVLEEAARESIEPLAIARRYEDRFHNDLSALNILPADHYPRASENIAEIITAIETLMARGSAYRGSDGNIYFDARSADSYGFISGNKLDALKPGHRYEYTGDGGKNFHADWALWKLAGKRSEMIWDSPWGAGFPGWHIECSAMSLNLLGDSVDIHVGGIDLRFPHHEDERAQTNALANKAAGEEVVHNWIHGEHLLFEGKKMAKSSGNVLLVSDIAERGLDPLALRLALLENRYRSQIDMTWQTINAADATLKRWRKAISSWGSSNEIKLDIEIHSFFMNDLETSKALLRLRAIEKDERIGNQDKRAIFLFADQVLGLDLNRTVLEDSLVELSAEALTLLEERVAARAAGNWAESDRIRDLLAESGIIVRDSKAGQSWELQP